MGWDQMSTLDVLKSKITHENKTIIGIIGIVLGVCLCPVLGLLSVLITILPAIFLVIPNETIKNSKTLAIISIIIAVLFIIISIYGIFEGANYKALPWDDYNVGGYMIFSCILQIVLCIYSLLCAFVLMVQTKPKQALIEENKNNTATTQQKINYDRYCSECGHGLFKDSKFCPGCGKNVDDTGDSEPETNDD